MRVAAYVGASTVLATGVILKAFHERPNFYSSSVYLAQSNACRMILLNQLLLTAAGCVYGLQRLLYGPLRPIEIEQLWDKSWYAITETALAMTTFRDEVGGWFFIMFMGLLAGKVWGWIGEGRVEILEQQPPANPRWFHTRLTVSLVLSEVFDLLMLNYCIRTLLEQPRPGMMVMFAFEFAILTITSTSTAARYCLTLQEIVIARQQTKLRIEERKQEIRAEREEALRVATSNGTEPPSELPESIEIDENDIDVPGWQEKGRWILFLDLATDFFKLLVYFGFSTILLVFHSIPIHIIRDVFITSRSFVKRISDFIKYRNATRDMNARFPDATVEDLERDCTCIICREEMRPWQPPNVPAAAAEGAQRVARAPMDERQRPKKLPCGHILHFGCLRSWLERQQVCPTCRASVLGPAQARTTPNQPAPGPGQPGAPPNGAGGQPNAPGGNPAPQNGGNLRARTFALGPLRVTLAAGGGRPVQDLLRFAANNQQQRAAEARIADAMGGNNPLALTGEGLAISEHLDIIQRRIMREVNSLNYAQDQLATIRALQGEYALLRIGQNQAARAPLDQEPLPAHGGAQAAFSNAMAGQAGDVPNMNIRTFSHQGPPILHDPGQMPAYQSSQQHVFSANGQASTIGPGHADLPDGMTLPEGWSLLPLQRMAPNIPSSENNGQLQNMDPPQVLEQIVPPVNSTQSFEPSTSSNNESNPQAAPATTESLNSPPTTTVDICSTTSHTSGVNSQVEPTATTPDLPTLPNWSNASFSPGQDPIGISQSNVSNSTNSVETTLPTDGSSRPSQSEQPNDGNSSTEGKGKGRAVTIEDLPEADMD